LGFSPSKTDQIKKKTRQRGQIKKKRGGPDEKHQPRKPTKKGEKVVNSILLQQKTPEKNQGVGESRDVEEGEGRGGRDTVDKQRRRKGKGISSKKDSRGCASATTVHHERELFTSKKRSSAFRRRIDASKLTFPERGKTNCTWKESGGMPNHWGKRELGHIPSSPGKDVHNGPAN